MDQVISESCNKGTSSQKNFRKFFVKFHGKNVGATTFDHNMTHVIIKSMLK